MKHLALSRFFIGLSAITILHQREMGLLAILQWCMFLAFMFLNAWDYQELHKKRYAKTPMSLLRTLLLAYVGAIASLWSSEVVILCFILFLLSCVEGSLRNWRKKSGTI